MEHAVLYYVYHTLTEATVWPGTNKIAIAIRTNAIITTFIESKKLSFGAAKCHSMHIGKECSTCPTLKVHSSEMEKSSSEKYLGDILSNDGSNKKNFESRRAKAWAIAGEILSILREVPLGKYKLEIGKILSLL